MTARYGSAVLIASGVTFVLFLIMQMLVATGNRETTNTEPVRFLGVIQEMIDDPATKEIFEPLPPKEVTEEPKIKKQTLEQRPPKGIRATHERQPIEKSPNNGPGLLFDGAQLPIVTVEPIYPSRALRQGVEGSAIVEFTITETGAVEDAVTVFAEPKGYFERASERAARKFKYKPKIVDGKPVRVFKMTYLFTFKIAE